MASELFIKANSSSLNQEGSVVDVAILALTIIGGSFLLPMLTDRSSLLMLSHPTSLGRPSQPALERVQDGHVDREDTSAAVSLGVRPVRLSLGVSVPPVSLADCFVSCSFMGCLSFFLNFDFF